MGEFIFGIILLLAGLATLAGARRSRTNPPFSIPGGESNGRHVLPPTSSARQASQESSREGSEEGADSAGAPTSPWAKIEAERKAKRQRKVTARLTPSSTTPMVLAIAGWLMTGIGALMVLASFVYTQDVGEAIVIRTPGGTISDVDTTPGFSLKAPWNDAVRFDVRNQVITMSGESGATDGPAINAQTSDNATAAIDITIRYSIIPAEVGQIYQQYRTQNGLIERALDVDVRSIVRDVPVKYTAGELRQRRIEVSSDIAKALQARWTALGVTVDSVDLRDIRYNTEIEQSLAAVQTARSRVESARAELESAKINAEKVKTEAQAQSDSDQIIRCGAMSTTVKEMIAGKEVTSVKVIPVPPAQCQNRLNEQVLTSKYIDMLKLAAEKGNTVYVVPPNQGSLLQLPAPSASASK